MPFWAAICWLLWRAGRGGGPGWWLALGLVSGVGLYAKFSTGLLLAGYSSAEAAERAGKALQRVRMTEAAHRKVG